MEPEIVSQRWNLKNFLAIFVLLVLSGVIGAILGPIFSRVPQTQNQVPVTASIKEIEKSGGAIVVGTPEDTHTITGTVKAIHGNNFILHTEDSQITDSPLVDRTVFVTSDTKVIKIGVKDSTTLNNEMNQYLEKIKNAKTKPQLVILPNQFSITPADVSEISINDVVVVTSLNNVSSRPVFTANQIDFHGILTLPLNK